MRDCKSNKGYLRRFPIWNSHSALFSLALFLTLAPLTVNALTLGQVDDFQDGTTDGWTTGHSTPANMATGGPSGAGDRFMQVVSTGGFGADSKLVVFNPSQWLGNYTGAGITGVAMYLANFGTQTL